VLGEAGEREHQEGDSGVGLSAFLSYARFDDFRDENALTDLREDLSAEVRTNLGLPFAVFQDTEDVRWQDTEDVRWGDDWQYRIETAVEDAAFLRRAAAARAWTR
jgi:hypothetical protein